MKIRTLTLLEWVLWLLVAFGVFVLPWSFPPKHAVESASYCFGFGNGIADLALAFCLAIFLALRLLDPKKARANRILKSAFRIPATASRVSKRWRAILIILVTTIVGGWWIFLPFAYFGEATYFLTKLDRMVVGQVPYRDFDFGYGPLMLYGPYWLYRLTRGLVAIDSAYIVVLLLAYTLGILAIDFITRNFVMSNKWQIASLVGATFVSTNITMGILYTPLRFVFPVWAAFFLNQKLQSSTRLGGAWLFFCSAVGFGISPECGVVNLVATFGAILWRWRERGWRIIPLLLCVGASLLAVWLLFGSAYFRMIVQFGGGAFNFPILPAPYLIALLIVACAFLPRLAQASLQEDEKVAPLFVSLLLATGLFLPAALGRCDPGHVVLNGLGLLLVSIGFGTATGRPAIKFLTPVCAAIMLITAQISFWNHYDRWVAKAFAVRRIVEHANNLSWKEDAGVITALRKISGIRDLHWDKRLPFHIDLLDLLRFSQLEVPIGCPEEVDRFLKLAGRDFPNIGCLQAAASLPKMACCDAQRYYRPQMPF